MEKAGKEMRCCSGMGVCSCKVALLTFKLSYFKSLGCGIGYGYLHRIPTRPFEEGKKISLPGQLPSASLSPLKDGFTEVSHSHFFGLVKMDAILLFVLLLFLVETHPNDVTCFFSFQ